MSIRPPPTNANEEAADVLALGIGEDVQDWLLPFWWLWPKGVEEGGGGGTKSPFRRDRIEEEMAAVMERRSPIKSGNAG
jgi:hypothetical protein